MHVETRPRPTPEGPPPSRGPGSTVEVRAALDLARNLVADGVERSDAARQLAAAMPGRASLEAAHHTWVLRMHRRRSDDHEATAVLRLLLAALAIMPRSPG